MGFHFLLHVYCADGLRHRRLRIVEKILCNARSCAPVDENGFRVDAGPRELEAAAPVSNLANRKMPERHALIGKPMPIFGLDRLPTPVGAALLIFDDDGALRAFDWDDNALRIRKLLRRQYGQIVLAERPAPAALSTALAGYFNGDLDRLAEIAWRVAGTPFQQKVWSALPNIPPGRTMSYGALAAQLQSPNAMRAVGHANGANPISVVLPCHRLIGSDGKLVKYGGGLARKRWLLRHEGVEV
jgi:methylated-DNA-[protein]-cysteine S-methyltransferase